MDRIDEYIDREGVKGDTAFIIDEINKVYEAFKKVDNVKITLSGAKSFKEAATSASALRDQQQELADAMREYEKLNQQLIATQTKYNVSQSEAAKKLAEVKEQLRQQNQEVKNQVREQNAAQGSIEQMRATLIRLNKEYDNLSAAERNASSGQELKSKIAGLSSSLKQLEGETGRFQRNVGNYSGAVKVLEDALQDVKKKLDDIDRSGGANVEVVEQLEKEYMLLSQVTESSANGFVSMREEIKKNQTAIEQLTLVLGEESPVVKELIQQNAELRDSYGDLVATQKALGSDTFAFDAVLQGGEALVGMYSAAEGAAALFGEENEDLQKTFVKLQAAMALVQGVQATVNALQTEGALVQGILAAKTYVASIAQKAFAFATAGATAAARAFNTALLAGGITAVLVLLPLVVQGMKQFTADTDDAAKSQDDLQKELEETKGALSDLNDQFDLYTKSVDRATKRAVLAAKERGASEEEILAIEQQGLVKRKQQLQEQKSILDEKYNNEQLSAEELKAINTERLAVQGEIEDLDIEIREKGLDRIEKINEKRKQAAKKATDDAKESKERELKAQFELIKYNKEQEIAYLKAQAETEGNPYKFRTAALVDALAVEESLITAQKNFELSNAKLTATERILIEQKASDDLLAKRTEYAASIIALRKNMAEKEREEIRAIQEATDRQNETDQAKQITQLEEYLETEIAFIQNAANRKLKALNEEYLQGTIDKETYEQRKQEIENESLRASLKAQIDYYKKLAELYFTDEKTRQDALKRIAELEKQLTDVAVSESDKRKEKSKADADEIKQAYINVANELKGLAFDIFTGNIDKEKNAIQEQIDALEEKKVKEIEVAEQSSTNEQEKADKIAVINAKAQTEKERLERRQRQLDEQKARFERAKAITDIIQNTAIAVSGYLAEQNYPMAILSGVIGAAQIARIIATPIPKYKHGRSENDPYEGPAIVNDGGKQEAIIRKDGSMELPQGKNTLTWVRKGDAVIPDASKIADLQMQFAKNTTDKALNMTVVKADNALPVEQLSSDIKHMERSMVRAVKSIPQTKIQVTGDIKRWMGTNYSWSEYLNNK